MSLQSAKLDFLEFFDQEEILDAEIAQVKYMVQNQEGIKLIVSISPYDDYVSFQLISSKNEHLVEFSLGHMRHIECDKNKPKVIMFKFYQYGKEDPIVTALVKPTISISLT